DRVASSTISKNFLNLKFIPYSHYFRYFTVTVGILNRFVSSAGKLSIPGQVRLLTDFSTFTGSLQMPEIGYQHSPHTKKRWKIGRGSMCAMDCFAICIVERFALYAVVVGLRKIVPEFIALKSAPGFVEL
ncbi:hypothetical protein Tcan_00831, partial [Toxocara canis]